MQNTKSIPPNQLFLILTINKLQRKLRKQPHIQELPKRTKYSEIKQVVTLKTTKYLWKKLKKTLINEDILSLKLRLPQLLKLAQVPYRFNAAVAVLVAQSCLTLCNPTNLSPPRLLCPCGNTGLDCHSLLQRIFLTQGSNPGLLHCRQEILYHLSYREDSVQSLSKSKGFLD